MGGSQRSKSCSDPIVEAVALPLEPIGKPSRRGEPSRGDLGVDIDQHGQIRPPPVHRPVAQPANLREIEAPAVALVRERGPRRPVTDDGSAGTKSGRDDLGHVFGPVCSHEERLGAGVQTREGRIQHGLPQPDPDARPPGSRVSTAPIASASSRACVDLPDPSPP